MLTVGLCGKPLPASVPSYLDLLDQRYSMLTVGLCGKPLPAKDILIICIIYGIIVISLAIKFCLDLFRHKTLMLVSDSVCCHSN